MDKPIKVFLSYTHDSREHSKRVLALADQLRQDGIEANIDQYEMSPPEGWPRWRERQIREADFVIVVCTETYLKLVEGDEQPRSGLDVQWESLLTFADLYDTGSQNLKYIPVSFEDDGACIPNPLRSATRYVLSSSEEYEALLRRLYGESAAVRPRLGPRRPLAPRSANPAFFMPRRNNFIEVGLAPSARFVGREDCLRRLHEQLKQEGASIMHALSGVGGVGKTQLTIGYVHRYADDYVGTWWLDASREALTSSVAKLAELLKIDTQRLSPEGIRKELCYALSQGRHLLVLDNVERLEDCAAFTLQAPSRVLITTRLSRMPPGRITMLHVDVLERESAIQMLRTARSRPFSAEDAKILDEVAEHLGDHPLALDFAAEYLRKYPDVTPQELLESLHRTEVGEIGDPLEDTEPEEIGVGYRLKVAKSIGLHLPNFEDTLEAWLLSLLAFCHPDDIPLGLLFAAAKAPKEEVRRVLRKLTDVSIIRYEQSISLHRLTQSVVRARLDAVKTRATLSCLVWVLRANFGHPEDHRSWPLQDITAPHALAALNVLRKRDLGEPPGMGSVLARYFQIRGRTEEAIWALGGLEPDGQLIDPNDVDEVELSNGVGSVLFSCGRLDESLMFFRRAEYLLGAQQGTMSRDLASVLSNMGDIFQVRYEFKAALEYHERAWDLLREVAHENVLTSGTILSKMGQSLEALERFDEAKARYEEAEALLRKVSDGGHPMLATVLMYLGDWWRNAGRSEEAQAHYREAARMALPVLGSSHWLAWHCVIHLAEFAREPGELDEAQSLLREVEAGIRAELGENHPRLLRPVELLASIALMKRDGDEALAQHREAEKIALQSMEEDHPRVAQLRSNIGQLLAMKGEVEEASSLFRRTLPVLLAKWGLENPLTCGAADTLKRLGGDPLEIARAVLGEEAARTLEKLLGPASPEV